MSSHIPQRPGKGGIALIAIAVVALAALVIVPLAAIIANAFAEGFAGFAQGITDPQTIASVLFSLLVTLLSVGLSAIFGLAAAWALGKFRFPGRSLVLALLDIPFALSPVLVGILIVLLYGQYGLFGPGLEAAGIQIIFAWPGVLLSTLFIVTPFVVKEVLPVLEERGNEEEEAALTLGAKGWCLWRRVTFPAIRTALLYGLVLAAARAAGEFGAANVVSGLIRGAHTTLPIHIEILYNDFAATQAFACATLFLVFALASLAIRFSLRRKRHPAKGDQS